MDPKVLERGLGFLEVYGRIVDNGSNGTGMGYNVPGGVGKDRRQWIQWYWNGFQGS